MASATAAESNRQPKLLCEQRYGLRAMGLVHESLEGVAELRQSLGLPGQEPFPQAFLKVADEQTVAAVAAVMKAIEGSGLNDEDFSSWGIVAAPKFLGRLHTAEFYHKYVANGARKMSLFFVPHRSLHSVSGTISQALQIKGPNFGAGGSSHAVPEGLLNALTLLEERELPGLWLVLSQFEPEPIPDKQGNSKRPVEVFAIAMAFTPVAVDWQGLRLELAHSDQQTGEDEESFHSLFEYLQTAGTGSKSGAWSCGLNWGCELRLSDE